MALEADQRARTLGDVAPEGVERRVAEPGTGTPKGRGQVRSEKRAEGRPPGRRRLSAGRERTCLRCRVLVSPGRFPGTVPLWKGGEGRGSGNR